MATTQTGYGEVKRVTFFDGSKIILNANSKLTYPKTHQGGDMQVELQGEAYFNIAHKSGQEQRLFSVLTAEGKVAVLGTKFNVNTHSEGTEVVLEEGKVKVQKTNPKDRANKPYIMSPGELAMLFSNKSNIKIQNVDSELYTSWKNFELKFKNTPLHRIADRIEEIYGVEVEFSNKSLREIEFSGSAPNKNFEVLLEGLRTLLKIPVTYEGNTIIFGS
nr:FecR domain-containing protein [Fodinibius salsisoli]